MKNFAQMPSKKLKALLETEISEEEKNAINEVLTQRGQIAGTAPAAPTSVDPNDNLSDEEKKAIDAANDNGDEAVAKPARAKAERMSDEERDALAEKMRNEALHHKCQVVPFNSITWVDGYVASIIVEKKTNKCLYAVKADDGRRIVKAYGSELIKILDEVVEAPARSPRTSSKSDINPWTNEEAKAACEPFVANVGKQVSFPEVGALGREIENPKIFSGRIMSLVPNKRTNTVLYRIALDPEEGAPADAPIKYAHKQTNAKALVLSESLDEEGQKINDAFVARRNNEHKGSSNGFGLPSDPVEAIAVAEKKLAKFQEGVERWTKKIEELKALIDKSGTNGNNEAAEGSENNDEELM